MVEPETIDWRRADEQGLVIERVLDARTRAHPSGEVFFVEHLVEYETGQVGWRRSMLRSKSGAPYSERYTTAAAADAAVELTRKLLSNPPTMGKPPLVHWKDAKEAGLKAVAVLDARIEPHKDGSLFFVQHLVRYDDGRCGWVRSGGESRFGKPYTEKHTSRELAEQSVTWVKRDVLLDEAEAILKARGPDQSPPPRYVLHCIYDGTPRDERHALSAERLIELARERAELSEAVAHSLREAGAEVYVHLLERAFEAGARSFEALIGSEHARSALRDVEVRKARSIVEAKMGRVLDYGEAISLADLARRPGEEMSAQDLVELFKRQEEEVGFMRGDPELAGVSAAEVGQARDRFASGLREPGMLRGWLREQREKLRREEEERLLRAKRDEEWRKRADEARELYLRKKTEADERREREHSFLRAKALEHAAAQGIRAPARHELVIEDVEPGPRAESVLDLIAASLAERPYLKHVGTSGGETLWVSPDGLAWCEWGRFERWQRKRDIAERAEMADAFGLDPKDHWGRVRGQLLRMLKPNELDMLHRRDVQEALDAALKAGRHLVVIRSFAFIWLEDEQRWAARDTVRHGSGGGEAVDKLWVEGPIRSTNYGRIIVLPYIKMDGTKVEGHTRNAPYEGRALPRAVERIIKFAVYDDLGRDDTWDHHGRIIVPQLAS